MSEPDEWQVDAVLAVLIEEFDLGFDVPIRGAANEAAEQRVRAVIRRALKAASPIQPRQDPPGPRG